MPRVSADINTLLLSADKAAARANLDLEPGTDVLAFSAAASQAEMEAGTEAALRTMSPLRVAQAIAALSSGGGGEITVQDEGVSLSTAATTINFVGAGVTASGTGSTKTITISGASVDLSGYIQSDITGLTGGTEILNIVGITQAGYDAIGTPDANTYYVITDAAAGTLAQFDATTSAQLAGVISDETGTGALVFANSPTLVTPALGTPASGTLTNCTGLPTAGLVDDAVTLAKMASGTAGNLITYDASGNPAAVATGTSGHVLTSNGAGAAPTFQAAAGGGSGDIVSDLVSAEISVTGATTATISRMHVCSGTTADYTLTLPAASGNAGKMIGVRMATGLTKLVTIDANSTELIDGTQTRIMWAGESAILLCDGTGWSKIAGRTLPMRARMYRTAALTGITDNTVTTIPLDTLDYAMPAAMEDGTNDRITIVRPGTYEIQAVVLYDALTAASLNTQAGIYKNGASAEIDSRQGSAGAYPNPRCFAVLALAAADYLALSTYHVSGGTEALYVLNLTNALSVIESPTW